MSQTISFENYSSSNLLSRTKLTGDIPAAATSVPVINSRGFAAGPVLVGQLGGDGSEKVTSTAPSNPNSIPVGATTLPHNSDDPVYMLFGDQIKVYSAPDISGTGQQPPDNTFTFLDTIDISFWRSTTPYVDNAGTTTTWYKYVYYNSVSTSSTALADSEAAQPGAVHYVSLDAIRASAGFSDAPEVTNSRIARFRDAAEREINGSLGAIVSLPLPQPTNPIIVQIAKNIAAGELMQDAYNTISPAIAMQGATKASTARHGNSNGDNPYTSLQDLVGRTVVLQDANYNDLTVDDAPGFNGYPDDSANVWGPGSDECRQFTINEVY